MLDLNCRLTVSHLDWDASTVAVRLGVNSLLTDNINQLVITEIVNYDILFIKCTNFLALIHDIIVHFCVKRATWCGTYSLCVASVARWTDFDDVADQFVARSQCQWTVQLIDAGYLDFLAVHLTGIQPDDASETDGSVARINRIPAPSCRSARIQLATLRPHLFDSMHCWQVPTYREHNWVY